METLQLVLAFTQIVLAALGVVIWYLVTSTRTEVREIEKRVEQINARVLGEYATVTRLDSIKQEMMMEFRRVEKKLDDRADRLSEMLSSKVDRRECEIHTRTANRQP